MFKDALVFFWIVSCIILQPKHTIPTKLEVLIVAPFSTGWYNIDIKFVGAPVVLSP